jgi:AraC family transcriptional regulator
MKVMVIIKASKASEAGEMAPPEVFAAMGKFNEELIDAGIMVLGGGLTASSRGARVRISGSNRTVTDGPFAETKELVAGFWVWKVSSLQEAIDWVKKCPNPMMEDSDIEIRPFMEAEELAVAIDPAVQDLETRRKVRARIINWTP